MKSVICTKYGPPEVLKITELNVPSPKDDEVLVEIVASTVTAADYRVRAFKVPLAMWLPARLAMGLTKPNRSVLGAEFSGVITAVGKSINRFRPGDSVLGVSLPNFGSYAQYLSINENRPIVKKPNEINFLEAAAIPIGAKTALYYLTKANIQSGQKIIIYGASGSVGSYAIQLANLKGATVTAVCSKQNFKLVKDLGANYVADYNEADWYTDLKDYDIFFEAVDKCSFSIIRSIIKKKGTYVNITTPFPSVKMLLAKYQKSIKLILAQDFPQTITDLEYLVQLVAENNIKPIIDKVFNLNEIVEAHRYADKGHKKGNVVIKINSDHEDQ